MTGDPVRTAPDLRCAMRKMRCAGAPRICQGFGVRWMVLREGVQGVFVLLSGMSRKVLLDEGGGLVA